MGEDLPLWLWAQAGLLICIYLHVCKFHLLTLAGLRETPVQKAQQDPILQGWLLDGASTQNLGPAPKSPVACVNLTQNPASTPYLHSVSVHFKGNGYPVPTPTPVLGILMCARQVLSPLRLIYIPSSDTGTFKCL